MPLYTASISAKKRKRQIVSWRARRTENTSRERRVFVTLGKEQGWWPHSANMLTGAPNANAVKLPCHKMPAFFLPLKEKLWS